MRLNKYIAETGLCSRRAADKKILEDLVRVNGQRPEMGQQVSDADSVEVEGRLISKDVKKVYMALHKPVGVTSTTDLKDPDNIVDYMKYPQRIFHVGRLDKPSEGLILMTNDGDIVNKILRAENNHEKEYIVTVHKKLGPDFVKLMSSGVKILDTITQACKVEIINGVTFRIILTQGLNRQIRRMCDVLGYEVIKLKRVRIMNIELKDLPYGQWRYLTDQEMKVLTQAIERNES